MSTDNKISAKVGEKLTALAAMTVPDPEGGISGINLQRGSVLVVTERFLEATKNRFGESWLHDLSDNAQISRWGEQRFVIGDRSDSIHWWEGDSSSTNLARSRAKEDANKISDPTARAEALAAIREKFGADVSQTVTLSRVAGDGPTARQDARSW